MSDPVILDGKEYVSSKRASELSGYAQDYIGQLARKGLIDAQRVGGLWHIGVASLSEYKAHADTYVPQQPERREQVEVGSLISFDGKDHISAARAAEITGYHPDYVGQLARSGGIISRQVGNRWYIDREGILAHKQEKDRLLGAVQAQAVGIVRNDTSVQKEASEASEDKQESFLTYTSDNGDLMPVLHAREDSQVLGACPFKDDEGEEYPLSIPIRVIQPMQILHHTGYVKHVKLPSRAGGKTTYYGVMAKVATAVLTVVIILSFGFVTLKDSSIYSANTIGGGSVIQRNKLTASAISTLHWIRDFLENLVVKELTYKREQWGQ